MIEPADAVSAAIGRLVATPDLDVDEARLDRAAEAFTDTIGVMLAGAGDPAVVLAGQVAQGQFGSTMGFATPVLELDHSISAAGAAFVNGVAAHALDYDDVTSTIEGHPSALLVPTLLALAEVSGGTGRDVLESYLVGLHVASGVGAGIDLRAAYARGWHLTSVLGTLGAAAAAARLCHLDEAQARAALGISGSLAAGSRASFGTMVKPLHVGMSAAQAILAVELATAGFTANSALVESPLGFLALHAESAIDHPAIERALGRPIGAAVSELDVKRYPCCYHAHRMIDAALAVRSRVMADGSEAIESVRVTTAPGGTAALIYHWPDTPTEAKFSAEFTVATALVDGRISDASFNDSGLDRAAVRAVMKRIEVCEADVPPVGRRQWMDSYAVVEVQLRDGGYEVERVDVAKGAHANPLAPAEVREKFRQCAAQHPAGTVDAARAIDQVEALRHDDGPGSLLRRILSSFAPEEH